jgi:hypothetical protein
VTYDLEDIASYLEKNPALEHAAGREGVADALPAMIRDLREAGEMLRELEWSNPDAMGRFVFCPKCGSHRDFTPGGHAPDCRLDALLQRLGRK